LIGICGGMQMLGTTLHDPRGLEGAPGSRAGLGLLDYQTTLDPAKQLRQVKGRFIASGARVSGYEIHMGVSTGPALAHPAIQLDDGCADGALSEDGHILATYLHGLFEEPQACAALLAWAGLSRPANLDYAAMREASIDRLANVLNDHLQIDQLLATMHRPFQ
jgi:adenosylcobyric acid synthase